MGAHGLNVGEGCSPEQNQGLLVEEEMGWGGGMNSKKAKMPNILPSQLLLFVLPQLPFTHLTSTTDYQRKEESLCHSGECSWPGGCYSLVCITVSLILKAGGNMETLQATSYLASIHHLSVMSFIPGAGASLLNLETLPRDKPFLPTRIPVLKPSFCSGLPALFLVRAWTHALADSEPM